MKKICFILTLIFILTLCSCDTPAVNVPTVPDNPIQGGEQTPTEPETPEGEYGKVDDNSDQVDVIHYLSFEVEGVEIAKLFVMNTDTYDALKPYFPTVPEKDGYVGEWEKLDYVYDENEVVITISAYYTKIR